MLETRAYALGHRDGVGVSFLVDGDLHALLAVDARDDLALLPAALHGGDVRQRDAAARLGFEQDDVPDVFDVAQLVERANEKLGIAIAQAAARGVDVVLRQRPRNVLDGHTEKRHLAFVQLDVDFFDEPTLHARRGDAFERFEVLLQRAVDPVT